MLKYFLLFIELLKYYGISLFLIVSILPLYGQLIRIVPENPSPDDSISIYFYADQGNKALENYDGDIYMHTAVITGAVDKPSSWRYIQGEWGQDDYRVKMRRIKPNVYRKDIHIRSFYRLGISEPFLQLAFVFRNLTGSLVAAPVDAEEVYYPSIDVLKALDLSQASGNDGRFVGSYQSHKVQENELLISAEGGDIKFTFFQNHTARVTFFPEKDQTLDKSHFILEESLKKNNPEITESDSVLICRWSRNSEVVIQKYPLRLSWYLDNNKILEDQEGFFEDKGDQTLGIRSRLKPDEKIFGLGIHSQPFNRRGHRFYLYHKANDGYSENTSPLNMTLPHFISSAGYSLMVDNEKKAYWDIGKVRKDLCEYGVRGGNQLTYVLMLDQDPSTLVSKMSAITGRQPIPPLWAFGYFHRIAGDLTQKDIENEFQSFQDDGIPLEAFVLENSWDGANSEKGNFAWDVGRFPNPTLMMSNLKEEGIKTVLGISPYIMSFSKSFGELASRKLLATSPSGSPYVISDYTFGQAALLDIFHPEASSWMWKRFEPLLAQGVDGWASREVEPSNHPYNIIHHDGTAGDVHNIYSLKWSQSIDRQYLTGLPGRRLVHFSSSGSLGIQRNRAFPYSGNPAYSWEGLNAQVGIMLSASLSGIPYMHGKIQGGDELKKRWAQLGAFSPVMIGGDSLRRSNTDIKEEAYLRYQFLPYNYSLAWEQVMKGLPLVRPMFFESPTELPLWDLEDQFLWGKDLIVAPMMSANEASRKVYFPKGNWVDFWNDKKYNAGWHTISASISKVPLFVREGALIPLIAPIQNTIDFKGDQFEFRFYPNLQIPVSTYEWYLDDGLDPNAVKSMNYRLVNFKIETSKSKMNITLDVEGNGYTNEPDTINCTWKIYHINNNPKVVKWANKKLKRAGSLQEFNETPYSFFWEANKQQLFLRLDWNGSNARLFIKSPKWSE